MTDGESCDRRERRDGAVHQTLEAGLDNLEDEAAALGLVLLVACASGLRFLIHSRGEVVVLAVLNSGTSARRAHPAVS